MTVARTAQGWQNGETIISSGERAAGSTPTDPVYLRRKQKQEAQPSER